MSAASVWVVKARDGSGYLGPVERLTPTIRYSTVLRAQAAAKFTSWSAAAKAILDDITCGEGWRPVRLTVTACDGRVVVDGGSGMSVHPIVDLPTDHPFRLGDRVRVIRVKARRST